MPNAHLRVSLIATAFVASLCFFTSQSQADDKGQWKPISESVLSQVKAGYPGKTAGVAVDPVNGDVYMVVCDQGIWRSTDHGETFKRADLKKVGDKEEKAIHGRCETGFALDADPAGKRL